MPFPFEIVNMRFFFNNRKQRFTVHYAPSLFKWYVFAEDEETNSLYGKQLKKAPKVKDINFEEAREILLEYLETVPAV